MDPGPAFRVGDLCEALAVLPVRAAEGLGSALVAQLRPSTRLEVLELGAQAARPSSAGTAGALRARVRATAAEGWVTAVTGAGKQLLRRRDGEDPLPEDLKVGARAEVRSLVALRTGHCLSSPLCGELGPGTLVRIEELGGPDGRRARVSTGNAGGWLSLATPSGKLLVGAPALVLPATARQLSSTSLDQGGWPRRLLEASRDGDLAELRRLLEAGAVAAETADLRRRTPLMYAAGFGHAAVVRCLLQEAHAEVNQVDDTQKTALHHATKPRGASAGQVEIVRLLCHASAMIDARDHNGCTPLMMASASGSVDAAMALVELGADVQLRDFEGHRPLSYAKEMAHSEELIQLLRVDSDSDSDRDTSSDFADLGEPAPLGPARRSSFTSAGPARRSSFTGAGFGALGRRGSAKRASILWVAGLGGAGDPGGAPSAIALEQEAPPGRSAREAARDLALQRLRAVAEEASAPRDLEAAVEEAEEAGVEGEELLAARQRLEALRERARAHERVLAATEAGCARALRGAIAHAEQAGVGGPDMDRAREALAAEEPREAARARLQDAAVHADVDSLRAAVAAGGEAGLAPVELAPYQEMIRSAESRQEAEATLRRAVDARSVPQLRFAVQPARTASVDAALVELAERTLREEEPRYLARERLERIAASDDAGDLEELRAAVAEARRVGLEPAEYAAAEDRAAELEEQQRALQHAREALEGTRGAGLGSSMEELREAKDQLSAALQAAKAVGVAEADLRPVERHRRKLHNMIEDLKGSIRVFCRVRPLSQKERSNHDEQIVFQDDDLTLTVREALDEQPSAEGDPPTRPQFQRSKSTISTAIRNTKFSFDAVFMPGTQEEVFDDCRDLVQSALDGYNVTIFAYGQTGAGKTFTMYGVPGQEGTTPRTIAELYSLLDRDRDRYQHTVMGSMMELYRDRLVDLLQLGESSPRKASIMSRATSWGGASEEKKLNVHVDKQGAVHVDHLTEEVCTSAESLLKLLERGNKKRHVSATAMNSESSRSHLLFVVKVVAVNRETHEQTVGKMLLVDLAGSERLKKSEVSGDQQKEAIEINKSLTALGNVIESLTQGQSHVPYKNHKLTQVMQDALGGTSKTLMFVNCSPASSNLDETLMSLKYATRAKLIVNDPLKTKQTIRRSGTSRSAGDPDQPALAA